MAKNKTGRSIDRKLTEKQERFCQYYFDTDGNASEAFRMSRDTSNMKPETVWARASELLKDSKVQVRLDEIRAERAKASRIERERVEGVLMDIIMADPNDLYLVDPKTGRIKMKSPNQLPKRIRNALKKIKNDKGVVEYELHGKIEAARLLGSWNGWDAPKEVNLSGGQMKGEIRIGFDNDNG